MGRRNPSQRKRRRAEREGPCWCHFEHWLVGDILDGRWRVVGLHHSGNPGRPALWQLRYAVLRDLRTHIPRYRRLYVQQKGL